MSELSIDDRLALIKYKLDSKPHIILKDPRLCDACQGKYCVHTCPAKCYVIENDQVVFHYEDCVECGSCFVVCDSKALDWNYPRGSYGVTYKYG